MKKIAIILAMMVVTGVPAMAEDSNYCEEAMELNKEYLGYLQPEFRCIEAYFNGKFIEPGSVPSPRLKIGEPFKVRVDFLVGQVSDLRVLIKSTGYITYEVVEGPAGWEVYTDDRNIQPGITKSYEWTLKPDGSWTMGNAPVRIFYSLYDNTTPPHTKVESDTFAIVNPYILNARYTGPETAEPVAQEEAETPEQPGFGVIAAVIGLAALACLGKRRVSGTVFHIIPHRKL